jgi:acyl-CoA thioester hydrolase
VQVVGQDGKGTTLTSDPTFTGGSSVSLARTHSIEVRVRYHETDGQGRVHNSQYLNYFERGRVEMLRSCGISYKELEATGLMLVVKSMQIEFHLPAEFDDDLRLETTLHHCHGARIEHAYRLVRSVATGSAELKQGGANDTEALIVTGQSVIACVDRTGRVRRLPAVLQAGIVSGRDG